MKDLKIIRPQKACALCGEIKDLYTGFYPALMPETSTKIRDRGRIPIGGGDRLDVCIDCVDAREKEGFRKCRS